MGIRDCTLTHARMHRANMWLHSETYACSAAASDMLKTCRTQETCLQKPRLLNFHSHPCPFPPHPPPPSLVLPVVPAGCALLLFSGLLLSELICLSRRAKSLLHLCIFWQTCNPLQLSSTLAPLFSSWPLSQPFAPL